MEANIDLKSADIQPLQDDFFKNLDLNVDVLRLDKIHSVVSGNKWFKLKYYLQQAAENNVETIATFGGAFSNHILATAYACNQQNFKCTGFIRGEKPKQFSQTLLDAQALNMQLEFVSRDAYTNKQTIIDANKNYFFIPEGGYGKTGAKGAAEIVNLVPGLSVYKYIVCAVGTGTMLAGITNSSTSQQQCIGISVLKNNFSLETEVLLLVNDAARQRVKLLHDYSFGGYAKHTPALIDFINETWRLHKLPLDFVYTAKALYAVYDLAAKNYFDAASKILFIHSGGLQGNRSLQNMLPF